MATTPHTPETAEHHRSVAPVPEIDAREGAGRAHLRRNALGVAALVFFVLSAQAPLTGIAGAAPISIAIGDGAGVPGSYVVAGIVIALFAVGYIAMSRHIVDAGAFYAYVGRGLGRLAGHGSAMVALLSYNAIQAGMYGLYGVVTSGLLEQHLGVSVPWWACALVTMAVIQVLGVLGIDIGAKVLALLVLGETSILLAFDVATVGSGGGPEGLAFSASFSPASVLGGAPGVALMFAIASMFGFESTAIFAEEAKDPTRTVPRATYLSVALITGFFAFTTWMLVSHYGPTKVVDAAGAALQSGNGAIFVFDAVAAELGAWSATALNVLLATSLLAGILAFHNAINRYLFALSRDGSLPQGLSRVNRPGAPWVASVTQTVLAVLLVMPFAVTGQDPVLTLFSWFSGVAVLAIMVLYLLTSVSVVTFFRRTGVDRRPWQTFIAPLLAAIAIAGVVYLILANFTTLIGGSMAEAVALVAAVPVLFLIGVGLGMARRRRPTVPLEGNE